MFRETLIKLDGCRAPSGLGPLGSFTQGVALGWLEAAPLGRYGGAFRALVFE
jgi:hypothetical protein